MLIKKGVSATPLNLISNNRFSRAVPGSLLFPHGARLAFIPSRCQARFYPLTVPGSLLFPHGAGFTIIHPRCRVHYYSPTVPGSLLFPHGARLAFIPSRCQAHFYSLTVPGSLKNTAYHLDNLLAKIIYIFNCSEST